MKTAVMPKARATNLYLENTINGQPSRETATPEDNPPRYELGIDASSLGLASTSVMVDGHEL